MTASPVLDVEVPWVQLSAVVTAVSVLVLRGGRVEAQARGVPLEVR